jgi:hypothetical protein
MVFYDEKGFDELIRAMGIQSEAHEYLGVRIRKPEKQKKIAAP